MSLITARGSEVNFSSKVDMKKVFIRLKENKAVRARILGVTDYVEYRAHSSFGHKEYKDDITETAFNFKKTGSGTGTSYKLNPILKMKDNDVEKFRKFDDVEVEKSFFETVLVPKSEKMMLDILNEAGFPMAEFFADYCIEIPEQQNGETAIF